MVSPDEREELAALRQSMIPPSASSRYGSEGSFRIFRNRASSSCRQTFNCVNSISSFFRKTSSASESKAFRKAEYPTLGRSPLAEVRRHRTTPEKAARLSGPVARENVTASEEQSLESAPQDAWIAPNARTRAIVNVRKGRFWPRRPGKSPNALTLLSSGNDGRKL